MQSQSNLKKKLLNLLKVVVSVGGLGFIFYKVSLRKGQQPLDGTGSPLDWTYPDLHRF